MPDALRWTLGSLAFLAALFLAAGAHPGRLRDYGEHLSAECITCHRLDGGGDKGIPAITGKDPADFIRALKAFKAGERTNPVMVSVARSLDEEQMQALAAYFGSLQPPKAKPGAE